MKNPKILYILISIFCVFAILAGVYAQFIDADYGGLDLAAEDANKIAEEKKLIPFKVNSKVGKGGLSLPEYIQPTVEEWIRGFYDAEFVVTDSFHACVFSILFNKPFIVYGNENRGLSRFTSVLNIFGLEERLLKNLSEYRQFDEIDWNRVNSLLEKKIKDSCKFLYKLGD